MRTNTKTTDYQCADFSHLENAASILTKDACSFITKLHHNFNEERKELLKKRAQQQEKFDQGDSPNFIAETKEIRDSDWVAAPIPAYLQDRRVEITGPVDRKMIINALNSGASCFMADFEDSNAPTWDNCVSGQVNLRDAVNQEITFKHPTKDKTYQLNENTATLLVRPRGLHLNEEHFTIKDEPISGALFDFGLFFFHNANNLLNQGAGPAFYLPKLEHHAEAAWWNKVFEWAQKELNIPSGSIKATVLIETITASFQLDEIIYALKDHMAGLNCGRWDYIFSYIKKLRNHSGFVVPDRDQVTMTTPFMSAYSLKVIEVCHKRRVHAMGGMAAQIPISNDEKANEIALEKVRKDKIREVKNGHDGTWVAHPALVKIAKEVFDKWMPTPNQIDKIPEINITRNDLLEMPLGSITEKGVRKNINVGLLYIESWLQGIGAAAIYHLMEDAATAEISRTQLWQWLHNGSVLDSGEIFTAEMYLNLKTEELDNIKSYVGKDYFDKGKFDEASGIMDKLVLSKDFTEFLTLIAYDYIK